MNSQSNSWRILNRNGTFNVLRKHGQIRTSDLYHSLLSLSWINFFLLVVIGYILINACFALLYMLCGTGALEGAPQGSLYKIFWSDFFFSVQTLATIGYGKISPISFLANILVTIEALTGLLGIAITTGLVFSRFSKPTAKIAFSEVALISNHDGNLSFLFRMANKRLNQVVEAKISVVLLRTEFTAEGERYRTFNDLKLERSQTPVFALTWTVVHPIDSTSPLFNVTAESLMNTDTEILVSFTGIDETFSQTIYARYSYSPAEILWGKHFKDILSRVKIDERELVQVDLAEISQVV